MRSLRYLIAATALIPINGIAEVSCSELFASIGRVYLADAERLDTDTSEQSVANCPASHHDQLQHDPLTVQAATAVQRAADLHGVWFSDDIKDVFLGQYSPTFEVLEIEPGNTDRDIFLTQRIVRGEDLADFFADEHNPVPSVATTRAGLDAVYGTSLATLAKAGELHTQKVRYHDFPIDTDRAAGLQRKAQFLSMLSSFPIQIKQSDDRLQISYFDRAFGPEHRVLTYRKRSPDAVRAAWQMARLGELSSIYIPCFVVAIDSQDRTLLTALAGSTPGAFIKALDEAMQLEVQRNQLVAELANNSSQATRAKLATLVEQLRALFANGPLRQLAIQAESSTPFGCVNPWG